MLEFPTFEEMVAVMNSPNHPPEPMDHADYLSSDEAAMEMSVDSMIREIYSMIKAMHTVASYDNPGPPTPMSMDLGEM